jgi:hypothetical protein
MTQENHFTFTQEPKIGNHVVVIEELVVGHITILGVMIYCCYSCYKNVFVTVLG